MKWWVYIVIIGSALNGLFLYYMMYVSPQPPAYSDTVHNEILNEIAAENKKTLTVKDSFNVTVEGNNDEVENSTIPSQVQPQTSAREVEHVQDGSRDLTKVSHRRILLFLHIESTPSPAGFAKRDRTRKSWLQFADPRFVHYRFFVMPPSPNHPQGKNALQLLRREQKNSQLKRGFADLVVRNASQDTRQSFAQWSILWADSELGLGSRFDYYLRVSDDSMLCLPQLLADLSFRPILRAGGPVFWGKFWCEPGVNVRPEEHFMLFSSHLVKILVFDWRSEFPLFPYHKERSLSQNIGFALWFLNASIVDDRNRLSGAQDTVLSASRQHNALGGGGGGGGGEKRRRRLFMFGAEEEDDGQIFEPSVVHSGGDLQLEGGGGGASSERSPDAPLLDRSTAHLTQQSEWEEEEEEEEVGSPATAVGAINSALHTTFCRRKLFTFKPGDHTVLSSMLSGLRAHVAGLRWTEGDDDERDDRAVLRSEGDAASSSSFLALTRWQLRSLYEEARRARETQAQAEKALSSARSQQPQVEGGEREGEDADEFLKPPCAIREAPTTSGKHMLLTEFGAPHKTSTVAFVDSTPSSSTTAATTSPMASLAFRSNSRPNPFLPASDLHRERSREASTLGRNGSADAAAVPSLHSTINNSNNNHNNEDEEDGSAGVRGGAGVLDHRQGRRQSGAGIHPLSGTQPASRHTVTTSSSAAAAVDPSRSGSVSARSASSSPQPRTSTGTTTATAVAAAAAAATTTTEKSVSAFLLSVGLTPTKLSTLTPAGAQAKTAAAVDKALARLGFGGVHGTLQERLELAALASSSSSSRKGGNLRRGGAKGARERAKGSALTGEALLERNARQAPPPPLSLPPPPTPPSWRGGSAGSAARAQGAAAAAEVVSALSSNTGPGMLRTGGGLRR